MPWIHIFLPMLGYRLFSVLKFIFFKQKLPHSKIHLCSHNSWSIIYLLISHNFGNSRLEILHREKKLVWYFIKFYGFCSYKCRSYWHALNYVLYHILEHFCTLWINNLFNLLTNWTSLLKVKLLMRKMSEMESKEMQFEWYFSRLLKNYQKAASVKDVRQNPPLVSTFVKFHRIKIIQKHTSKTWPSFIGHC